MSISKIENFNINNFASKKTFLEFKQQYYNTNSSKSLNEKEDNLKVKVGVISAAVVSTLGVLSAITKKRGQNPFKNFNIFKQEITPMNMLHITGVSVPASLLTGIALDKKENTKPKLKEGISQMVGNLIIPITMVNESIKLKNKIDKKLFKNPFMKGLQKTHKAIYTTVALLTGLYIGNNVANGINSKLFDKHKKRPIKLQDFSAHFDDVCFAASLIFRDNKIGDIAGRFIPATLLVSAYETGIKTINDKNELCFLVKF